MSLLIAVLGAALAPEASAHAFLVRSTPSDGSTLARSPSTMRLTFDEDVVVSAASMTLRAAGGSVLLAAGSPAGAQHTSKLAGPEVLISLPGLRNGAYSATWTVQSADDLHSTSGTVSFAIGPTPLPPGVVDRSGSGAQTLSSLLRSKDSTGTAVDALSTSVRWLDFAGIALLLGALLLMATVISRAGISTCAVAMLRTALWRVLSVTAAVEVILGVVVLVDSAGGVDLLGLLTSTPFGRLWLLREAGFAAVALWCILATRHQRPAPLFTLGALALTVGSLAAVAGTSHVGVGIDRPLRLLLLVTHLSFAGAWAGAVLLLSGFLVLERTRGVEYQARRLMRSFGAPAACCVAVAIVTGISLAARQVASLDALLTTTYGRVLIVKVLAVGLAALLGLRTTIRLRRSEPSGPARLSGGVALESAALLFVLAAAAALSAGTPARSSGDTSSVAGGPSLVSAQVGDLLESAALVPNTVGQNWLRVDVNQTRRPAPGLVTGVSAVLLGPRSRAGQARPLVRTEIASRWELGGIDLSAAGTWRVALTVHRAGRPDTLWRARWIAGGSPPGVPLVSDRSWESALDHIALVIALLTLPAGIAVAVIERRRRRRIINDPERSTPFEERTLVRL